MQAYASDIPKGLVMPADLKKEIDVINNFLTVSKPFVDFMDHEQRILLHLGTTAPAFDTSIINGDLFRAVQDAKIRILALIDSVTSIRAEQKINIYRIDAGNKRFIDPPSFSIPSRASDMPMIIEKTENTFQSKPLFNVTPPPSDRVSIFKKEIKNTLRQKIPSTIISKVNESADQLEFLYQILAEAKRAEKVSENLLGILLTEGVATPAQIEIARLNGMITASRAREITAFTQNNMRHLLMRPRPFGVEPPAGAVSPLDVMLPAESPVFSQAASYPQAVPTKLGAVRRTLTRYPQLKIPSIEYHNQFGDVFADPFNKNPYGTKFLSAGKDSESAFLERVLAAKSRSAPIQAMSSPWYQKLYKWLKPIRKIP